MLAQKVIKTFIPININDFTFAYRIYPKYALKKCKISEFRNGWALELLLCPYKKNMISLQYQLIGQLGEKAKNQVQ